jgi:hypothetical protein
MEITKGQVDQLFGKYHVSVYGMSYEEYLKGDPGLVHDLVAMHRGKSVTTGEKLTAEDILGAFKYFFVEGVTGPGATPSSPTGEPELEKSST